MREQTCKITLLGEGSTKVEGEARNHGRGDFPKISGGKGGKRAKSILLQ